MKLVKPVMDTSFADPEIPEPEELPDPSGAAVKAAQEPGELVFDYYDRVVGTPVKRPYYEVCLYKRADGQIILRRYINGGMPDETMDEHAVPSEALEGAMALVKKYRMDRWNKTDKGSCIEGRSIVCKFISGGKLERVSTNHFPDKYYSAFSEIKAHLDRY